MYYLNVFNKDLYLHTLLCLFFMLDKACEMYIRKIKKFSSLIYTINIANIIKMLC